MTAAPTGVVDGRAPRRILALLPLIYHDEGGFWHRDMGLLVRGFRALGHDAWLVVLKHPTEEPSAEHPIIPATLEELGDPGWWRNRAPDAIILNTWAAPRYEAIRRAALSLKKPIVEKLDTDGVKSPRIWLARYALNGILECRYSDSFLRRGQFFFRALLKTVAVRLFPVLLDAKMVRGMSQMPVLAAETPLAVARVKRFLRLFRAAPMPRVVTIPHPVETSLMRSQTTDQKENIVIAVARWDVVFKGWPLLLAIARRFLLIRPDWKIVVAGTPPLLWEEQRREIESFQGRLLLAGHLERPQLAEWYRRSRIYLLTSHGESFNIAAAEALCCGCSVVGPSQMASANYFAGWQSGTPSYKRTPDHMTDALLAEVDEWETGRRDPTALSKAARKQFGVEEIAVQYLRIFEELKEALSAG